MELIKSKRSKLRKLRFPIGIISAILLPLSCMMWLKYSGAFTKLAGIEIVNSWILEVDDSLMLLRSSEIEFTDLIFTEKYADDSRVIDSIKMDLRRLEDNSNKKKGIRISINEHMKYDRLIEVLDLVTLDSTLSYSIQSKKLLIIKQERSHYNWYSKVNPMPIWIPTYSLRSQISIFFIDLNDKFKAIIPIFWSSLLVFIFFIYLVIQRALNWSLRE